MAHEDKHWVIDEEVLERFVLGRLNADERAPLEAHLRQCEQCRTAVTNEARIAAGIRLHEQQELKSRLINSIEERKKKKTPFVLAASKIIDPTGLFSRTKSIPRYAFAGTAAVIVIVAGLGMYNRWFAGQPKQDAQIAVNEKLSINAPTDNGTDRTQVVEKSSRPSADREIDDRYGKTKRSAEAQGMPPESFAANEENRSSEQSAKVEVTPPGVKKGGVSPSTVPKEGQKDENLLISMGTVGETKHDDPMKESADIATPANGIWLEGRETPSIRNNRLDKRKDLRAEQDAARAAGPESEERKTVTSKTQPPEVKILQRPFGALPALQQQSVRDSRDRVVVTLLKQSADKTEIVLFSDPPMPESEVEAGRAILVGEDSLVLFFPTRQISYQLPQGWRSVKK